MAAARDDGGPAFPAVTTDWHPDSETWRVGSEGGMTLRDYFAAKAMASLVIASDPTERFGKAHPETNTDYAIAAYTLADAMLKARAQ